MPDFNKPTDDRVEEITEPTAIGDFYLDVRTGEVHEGKVTGARHRLGPYPTRAAAEEAYDRADARNEAWEAADREWNDEDEDEEQ